MKRKERTGLCKEFLLPLREKKILQRRAYQAQQKDQSEVCGIMLCTQTCVLTLQFLPNLSPEPGKFLVAKKDLRTALLEAKLASFRVLGSFHSHPITEAIPGPNDITHAFLNSHELIYDVCGADLRLWRKRRSRGNVLLRELPLRIID
jgi:proteasome lid subunit RPN8/RPN11